MAETIDLLHFSTLTETVQNVKRPNRFFMDLLFGDHRPVPTEHIEIGLVQGNRQIAPFVQRGSAGIMVGGYDETFQTVAPPNIRIKRPISPEVLFRRQPGMDIFADQNAIQAAAERAYLADAGNLRDRIDNAIEYLCALAVRGTITYQTADEANFTITYPRAAGHTVTLSGADLWTATTTSDPAKVARVADRLVSEAEGLNITDAVMDATTADLFMASTKVLQYLESRPNLDAGSLSVQARFNESGARLLGTFAGIRWWEYGRTVLNAAGSSVALVRPKFVEFFAATPAAENRLYYGAIEDLKALDQRLWVGESFTKSWVEEDPSARIILSTSRPLPVPRRPNSYVSVQVIA